MSEWWITNISKMNVCLSDLALTVPAGRSMNLLDSKHFYYTVEQLEKSRFEGSIFKKRDKIKVGITHQQIVNDKIFILSDQPIQTKKRSAVKVEDTNLEYDDWLFSDEEYAEEMAREYDDND